MRRAAERVDRLVGVADDAQLGRRQLAAGRPDQLLDQHVLRVVGVLVLVDQHVPEPAPVVLGDRRERLQQVTVGHDQVVEVERVRLAAAGAGTSVYASASTCSVGRCSPWPRTSSGSTSSFFRLRDLGRQAAGRVALRVEVELAARPAASAAASRPRRRSRTSTSARACSCSARRIRTHIEWNVDTHIARARGPTRCGDPLLHLAGGLVGEGDRQDLARVGAAARPAGRRSGGSAPGSCRSRRRPRSAAASRRARPPPAAAGLRPSSSLSGSTASRTRRGRRGSGAESPDSVGISIWLLPISEQAYDWHRHFRRRLPARRCCC